MGDRSGLRAALLSLVLCFGTTSSHAAVLFETTSAYHHIRVVDNDGMRTLSFDGSQETRMSIANPLAGHFEYTEYFHMPWLWNPKIARVLMIGLGGASTQRSFAHYHPRVEVDSVEIDPAVVRVAKDFFYFKESPRQRVHIQDGRLFLRRSRSGYDLIIVDAYVQSRYGSSIPHHLATKEFFELAAEKLGENGVFAYNLIGSIRAGKPNLLDSVYRTMKEIFPRVYLFPARTSRNVVLLATKSKAPTDRQALLDRSRDLANSDQTLIPAFSARTRSFRSAPPPNYLAAPVLTDDFAPIGGLISVGR